MVEITTYVDNFFHLFMAVNIGGMFIYSYALSCAAGRAPSANIGQRNLVFSFKIDLSLLVLLAFAFVSGAWLVVAKGYTFTTPWIESAIIFLALIWLLTLLLLLRKRRAFRNEAILAWYELHITYGLIFLLYACVVHDAVIKTTFLRW